MKIVIPTLDGKLCAHFGHCETFSFVEVNPETKEIVSIETNAPEDGISCQSAGWIGEQGADLVLAGGMGGRPMMMFEHFGIQVVSGCPELEIEEVVKLGIDICKALELCKKENITHNRIVLLQLDRLYQNIKVFLYENSSFLNFLFLEDFLKRQFLYLFLHHQPLKLKKPFDLDQNGLR